MEKSIFDYFCDFATALGIDPNDEQNHDCFEGIKDYLTEIGIDNTTKTGADKIARRELLRFKYINHDSFKQFFDHYQDRSRLLTVLRTINLRAVSCIQSGVGCDPVEVGSLTEAFYSAAASLSTDGRYKGWLNERIDDVEMSLENLRGISNNVNADVAKYLAMNQIDSSMD